MTIITIRKEKKRASHDAKDGQLLYHCVILHDEGQSKNVELLGPTPLHILTQYDHDEQTTFVNTTVYVCA